MSCDDQKEMLEVLRSLRETIRSMPGEITRSLGRPPRAASHPGEGGDGADGEVDSSAATPAPSAPFRGAEWRTLVSSWSQFVPEFRRFAATAARGRQVLGVDGVAANVATSTRAAGGLGGVVPGGRTPDPTAEPRAWQMIGRTLAERLAASGGLGRPALRAFPGAGAFVSSAAMLASGARRRTWRAAASGLGMARRGAHSGIAAARRAGVRFRDWTAAKSAQWKSRRSALKAASRYRASGWNPKAWNSGGKDWGKLFSDATSRLRGHGAAAFGRWNFHMPGFGGVGSAVGRSRLARQARVAFKRGGRRFRAAASGLGRKFSAGVGAFARRPRVAAMGRGLGRAASAAAGAGRVAVGAAASFGGGFVTAAIAELAADGLAMAKSLRTITESINASNRQFARYNPRIGAAMAGLEFGDFRRNVMMGRQLQEGAAALAGDVDRMRDAWQGFDAFTGRIRNGFARFGAGAVGGIGEGLSALVGPLDRWMKENDPANGFGARLGNAAGGIATGAAAGWFGGGIGGAIFGAGQGAINGWNKPVVNAPKAIENPWGQAMHQMVRVGPLVAPRRVPPP